MRSLAARLGVVPRALYHHVATSNNSRTSCWTASWPRSTSTPTPPWPGLSSSSSWPTACARCWRTIPGSPPSSRPRPARPHSLALAEALLAPLQAAGFADREAGLAFSLLVDYTVGFAVSSTPTSVNEHRVRDPATRAQLHQFFRSLPPDHFPALVALGEHVWVDNRDERFTAGLDVLVDGDGHARRSPHRPARRGATDHDRQDHRRREDAQQAVAG